jgi:CRISPR-associated protein Cmr1
VYERKYELITPLFGGGVKAGQTDPITVINAKSIRGQLRFWWRAVRGGQFDGDLQRMRTRESIIWGSASTEDEKRPSLVQTIVQVDAAGEPVRYRDLPPELKYGAFPLQQHNGSLSSGVRFSLTLELTGSPGFGDDLSLTRIQLEVEAALWAWETFGGIGARTRRGFGAIRLLGSKRNGVSEPTRWNATDIESAFAVLEKGFDAYHTDGRFPPYVSHISFDTKIKFHTTRRNGLSALKDLLESLKRFRQGYRARATRPPKPGGTTSPPGRSNWPEPETVRQLTGQRLGAGIRSASDLGHPPVSSFVGQRMLPRAQLGLPIVFEFHREDRDNSAPDYDPRKTVLQMRRANNGEQSKAVQRWASPLILRPLSIGHNIVLGMAVYLEGSKPPFPLALYEANGTTLIRGGLSMGLSPAQARAIASRPGAPPLVVRGESGSEYVDTVLDFLDTL